MTLRDTHTDLVHIGLMIGMTAVSIVMCVIFFFFQFLEILRKALAYINAVNASIRLSDCLSVCVYLCVCVYVLYLLQDCRSDFVHIPSDCIYETGW